MNKVVKIKFSIIIIQNVYKDHNKIIHKQSVKLYQICKHGWYMQTQNCWFVQYMIHIYFSLYYFFHKNLKERNLEAIY